MSLNAEQQIAIAFRAAKLRLATTEDEWAIQKKDLFICHALDSTRLAGATAAIRIVMNRLHDEGTVVGWLMHNVPAAARLESEDKKKFADEVQAFRHRWLDALIEEFSNGDE